MRIKEKLQHIIKNSLITLEIDKRLSEIIIEPSNEKHNGDYYTNVAISLANILHEKPEEIAQKIKNSINDNLIKKIEISYPGTISIFLNKKNLFNGLSEIIEKNVNYGRTNFGDNRKINIDFVIKDIINNLDSKEIYTAVYVDNLYRLLKYNGFEVEKELYYDDTIKEIEILANTSKERYNNFCKLEQSLEEISEKNNAIRDTAYYIYALYRNTKQEENIEYFKKEEISNLLNKRKNDLDRYRINFNNYLSKSSLYNMGLVDLILDKLNKSGLTYFDNDELWIKLSDFGYNDDKILIDSNGEYTSILPQLAYYVDKLNRKYDGTICVYNDDSSEYQKSLIEVLSKLNYDTQKIELKKISNLEFLTKETENLDINNLRYFFACQKKDTELIMDLENSKTSLDTIEKTNIIIYDLLKNHNKKVKKINNYSTMESDYAYIILNKLYEFEDIVTKSCLKQSPYLLCDYLQELVSMFNEYYNNEVIINDDEVYTNERLNFLLAIKIVINNTLNLIGIIPREEL